MKRYPIILLFLTAMFFAPSVVSAESSHYELHIGEFHKLQIDDNVNVVWRSHPDSAGYVRFHGADRFADAFIFSNKNGSLKVQVAPEDVNQPDLPVLYIYSSFLSEVKSSSALTVTAVDVPAAAQLKFTLIGNGSITATGLNAPTVEAKVATGNGIITLSGKCNNARFSMVGTGQIRADEFLADDVNCQIMGTGAIYTCALKSLHAKGIGSTKIYYRGNPAEVSKRGGGKFIQMTDSDPVVNVPAAKPVAPSVIPQRATTSEEITGTAVTEEETPEEVAVEQEIEEEVVEEPVEEPVEEEVEEAVEEEVEEEEEEVTVPQRRN